MDPIDYNERTCIITIEKNMDKMGLIVDAVNEIINISPNESVKMNSNSNKDESKQNFIKDVSEINNEIQLILGCDSLIEIVADINNGINE